MARFVDREQELDQLFRLAEEGRPHFLIVYGRRRLGKTTLLLEFAARSGYPALYWVASKQNVAVLQRSLYETAAAFLGTSPPPGILLPSDWSKILEFIANGIREKYGNQRVLIILDEFPYAVESSPPLPSVVQNAWDHHLKPHTNAFLVIMGSHVGMMAELQEQHAPLYGRFTARLPVGPLPFSAIKEFFPSLTAAERVGVFTIFGGVPAYLERVMPEKGLRSNIEQEIMAATGIFRTEAFHSLQEELRDPYNYHSILQAIGQGHHAHDDISLHSGVPRTSLPKYLKRLIELGYVDRQLPATIPPQKRRTSRLSRYMLADQFLRFFYRFISPNLISVEQGLFHDLWQEIDHQMRAFVGATVFEDLCREWVRQMAVGKKLAFNPQIIGSHWSKEVQIDVAAINWRSQDILLGECKWGTDAVGRSVISDLVESKTDRVMKGLADDVRSWTTHYVVFARGGFTKAARTCAAEQGTLLVDLVKLDRDLE